MSSSALASAAATDDASFSLSSLSTNQTGQEIRKPGTRAPDVWDQHTRQLTEEEQEEYAEALKQAGKAVPKETWRCIHCNVVYSGRSLKRVVAHIMGITGTGIAVCKHASDDVKEGLRGKKEQVFGVVGTQSSSSAGVAGAGAAPPAKRHRQATLEQSVQGMRNATVRVRMRLP